MKVLHIIPSIAKVRGGPSKAIIEMVLALRHQGIDAVIATTNDNGNELLDLELNTISEYLNVPVYFFKKKFHGIKILSEFNISISFTTWLIQNIHVYDLVHIHGIFSFPTTFAMYLARKNKVPYVVRPFGMLGEWALKQGSTKKRLYLQLIERKNLNSCSAIQFMSEQEKREAKDLKLISKNFILPHGLVFNKIAPGNESKVRDMFQLDSDAFIILFMSRIHPKKGLPILINALSLIKDANYHFLIAGNGDPDYEAIIQDLIDKSGIKAKTSLLGFVSGEKKDLILQGSNLFVLSSYSENFGIAVLEALAAGLPTIVSPYVALSELIQQQEIGKVVDLDSESLSKNILYMIENKGKANELGKKAQEFILSNYSWNPIIKQLILKYKSFLKSHID